MPDHHLSPHLHEKYTNDLLATMRRIEQLEAEKKECAAFIGDVVKTEDARTRMLRDLLEGKVSEQVALPGLDEPVTRQREIGARLRMAVEKVELICNVDREVQDFGAGRKGETTITVTAPGGKGFTATQGQMRAALDELDRRKSGVSRAGALAIAAGVPATREQKEAALEKLVGTREEAIAAHEAKKGPVIWHHENDGRILGESSADHLMYQVEADGDRFRWTCGKKKGRGFPSVAEAKKDVERAELVRLADAKLKSAGHKELTGKAVTGEATAFKNGGRRG